MARIEVPVQPPIRNPLLYLQNRLRN
jgi:hypothetical protein